MSVHAGSRDLDGPLPVEVVVAEVKGQLLKDVFLDGRVVVGHIEVGRCHTALGGILGNQEEVILSVAILPFNHCSIDQSARLGILNLVAFQKEFLIDSLVDDD